jgi:gas vesicle protein
MTAKKVADDALSEANKLGEMAKQTASLTATETAKGVFKGLGLNNANCRLDENNILSDGRNNSLVKYAECMAEVAKNTAVTETTKGLKTVFDNLGLNTQPCVLDTNNIFTAGSGNALVKYAECRGNQAIDSLPKPTILGCEVSVRNIPAAVSCIENSAKNAVMGPINTLASGFTTEMNNMLNKFKNLINMINGFGDTIWKFFQDIINTIKSQATLFIERINSEGGKILEKIKNEAGKVVSYVTTEGDRIVKYILDQAGNIVKIITTQGNLILEKVKDQAGNIITFITTESGKVIKTVTDTGGQMVAYIKNKSGEFVKVATSTADKVISSVKDESGKIIKFVETSGGAIVKIVTDESGKIIRTVTDTGGKIVSTVSEKTVEFTTDASKFGKELLDIVLEQGKKAHETIGEVGQSISDSVSGIVDKIKEYTKIVSDIWEKIKEVGGMILKALWNGIVAVGRTIKWIIVNGPGWAMTYMKFWKKNFLIMRYNMPILIIMTAMIIEFVQTSSYLITGQTQAIPLLYLSLGAFGTSMIVANLFENIIRYLNHKIISNTIKQLVMTISTVIVLKVVIVDFLLGAALPKFVQNNIILSSVIAIGIFLSSSGYLLYNNYNKKEEPIEPGIIDDIKGYFQNIIDTTKDIVDV